MNFAHIGERKIDRNHDWLGGFLKYKKHSLAYYRSFMKQQCDMSDQFVAFVGQTEQHPMTTDQQRVLDYIKKRVYDGKIHERFLLEIVGHAGTGKSFCLHQITQLLHDNNIGFRVSSITGTASANAHGNTAHSLFGFSIYHSWDRLAAMKPSVASIAKFKDVEVLIIDEIFLMGGAALYTIDQRLQKIKGLNDAFGGLSIIIAGDVHQLIPVCDTPLYAKAKAGNYIADDGVELYHSIQDVLLLNQNCRQRDDQTYFECIEAIRTRKLTEQVVDLINGRHVSVLDKKTVSEFQTNGIYLFAKRLDVNKTNESEIVERQIPVVQAYPLVTRKHINIPEYDESLYLGPGLPVILRTNLCVSKFLTNGTMGTITDVYFSPDQLDNKGKKCQGPKFVTCEFPDYTGKRLDDGSIPIFPMCASVQGKDGRGNLSTFPLSLAYAMTIHRSQSRTMSKVIINIDDIMDPAMMYVAFSRVRSLNELMITGNFLTLESISNNGPTIRDIEIERLESLFKQTIANESE